MEYLRQTFHLAKGDEELYRRIARQYCRQYKVANNDIIETILAEERQAARNGDRRCKGVTRNQSECGTRALPGSAYCRFHQRQTIRQVANRRNRRRIRGNESD